MIYSSVKSIAKNLLVETDEKEYEFEELVEVERRRREVLKRNKLPFIRKMFFWDGTVFGALFHDPLIYACMSIYVLVRIGAKLDKIPDFLKALCEVDLTYVGGFLSFFLVFFVNQSFERFYTLYGASMKCEGCVFNVAALVKTSLPQAHSYRLIRYMNAAHVAGYVGLSGVYDYDNFFKPLNEKNHFLTQEECDRMKRIDMDAGGSAYRELVVWCIAEVNSCMKLGYIDSEAACSIKGHILDLRGALGSLFDYDDQPINFFYLHFICLLSSLYLPLSTAIISLDAAPGAIADDCLVDVAAGILVFLQCVFMVGLRILGEKLEDPYGDDVEDLSVMHYCNFVWRMSTRMIHAELPKPIDADQELQFSQGTQNYGTAWGWKDPTEKDHGRATMEPSAPLHKEASKLMHVPFGSDDDTVEESISELEDEIAAASPSLLPQHLRQTSAGLSRQMSASLKQRQSFRHSKKLSDVSL